MEQEISKQIDPKKAHLPQCHGDGPEDPNWCCRSCCAAGYPLPGHTMCGVEGGCGRWKGRLDQWGNMV